MKEGLQTIGKIIFPATLTLLGIYLVFQSVLGGQNVYFLAGGLAILVTAVYSLVLIMGMLSSQLQKISLYLFLVIAVVISFFSFKSINDPIEFEKAKKVRYAKVIDRLKDVRTAQIAYKSVYGRYTGDLDSLVTFIKTDKFLLVKSSGNVPDGYTEQQAIKEGYAKRDTFFVNVKDSLFTHKANKIDSLPYVPFGGGEKFKVETGSVMKSNLSIQVIEVNAPNPVIFKGLTDRFYNKEGGLKFGSMSEPSTNGNWE